MSSTNNQAVINALMNGFDKTVQIHFQSQNENDINLEKLFKAINSLPADSIEPFYEHIRQCKRDDECAENWKDLKEKLKDEKSNQSELINMLKQHNRTYYDEKLRPLLKPNINFKTSKYRKEQFIGDAGKFKTLSQMLYKFKQCLAINTHGGYIIKLHSEEDNKTIQFQCIKEKELNDQHLNINFEFDSTEEEKEKMRNQHKKVQDTYNINSSKLLKQAKYISQFDSFDGIALLSSNPKVLQLYNPPAETQYDKQLILDWIAFMKTLIHNTDAFDELLKSHAYRFRNPDDFIEKFFVNYGTGNNGKSFLVACLAKIYPGLANSAVRQEQIENDTFNAWTVNNLQINIEEAQQSNYKSKTLGQRVKQMTTKNASVRGMYNETKSARNWAICSMNTNKKDLYGLIREDIATTSRLVILNFKDNLNGEIYSKAEMNKKCHSFIDNPNFAYSLYHYLSKEQDIGNSFNPCRYEGKDKDDFIDAAQGENRNSVEDWLVESYENNVEIEQKENEKIITYKDMFRKNKSKAQDGKTYIFILEKDANESYNTWKESHKDRLCLQYIKDTMEKLGFKRTTTTINKVKGVPIYKINETEFQTLITRLTPKIEDDGEEIEIDELEYDNKKGTFFKVDPDYRI